METEYEAVDTTCPHDTMGTCHWSDVWWSSSVRIGNDSTHSVRTRYDVTIHSKYVVQYQDVRQDDTTQDDFKTYTVHLSITSARRKALSHHNDCTDIPHSYSCPFLQGVYTRCILIRSMTKFSRAPYITDLHKNFVRLSTVMSFL